MNRVDTLGGLGNFRGAFLARRRIDEAVQLDGALEHFHVDLVRLRHRIGDQGRFDKPRRHRVIDLFTSRLLRAS